MIAAKRLIQKAVHHHHHQQLDVQRGNLKSTDLDLHISVHYGVPSTASLLAFDSIQRLLAIATLDGRIKVIGGDGIEGIFISPKQLPYKNLEFLQNRGFLVSISNENDIEVWNLKSRCLKCCLQWEKNITAFSVISGSYLMYIGDEYGLMSVVKYDADNAKLLRLPYNIPSNQLNEVAGFPSSDHQPIVGLLPHPCSSGNRVLIAYENGLMVLWDVSEARILFVGGSKDLQLKDGNVDSQSGPHTNLQDNASNDQLQDKEISALCWASSNGSILAVGYVDGDILFWKTSTDSSIRGQQNESSSSNIVKLRLSSAERRLPVIVLHWSASNRSSNGCDGHLFIYGGDEIGAEEVLTVLTLEWSSRTETLRCTGRADITLTGSFADMILSPSAGSTGGSHKAAVFVLTNPGKLHLYDEASLSVLLSQQEKERSVSAVEFPAMIPMADPSLTLAKFTVLPACTNLSKVLSEMALVKKQGTTLAPTGGIKWPLTGGVPAYLSSANKSSIERLYIAGYEDGSVRFWNASCPVLSPICVIEGKVEGVEVAGFSSPVSSLDFCPLTLTLAVGNKHGVVRIYNLSSNSTEKNFHLVTQNKNEIHILPQGKRPHCRAVFSLLTSPIHVLQFPSSGEKLAIGFEYGRVAVLDMCSLTVLFFTDCLSSSSSPVISLTWLKYESIGSLLKTPKHSETNTPMNPEDEVIFSSTKDGFLNIINGCSEDSSPVSVSTNGKQAEESFQDMATHSVEPRDKTISTDTGSHSSKHASSAGATLTTGRLMDPLILLCCEDSLSLYSAKNVIQGNSKSISKVKHTNPCCWVSTFKKDEKVCGLILLFQTGVIEIRSFLDFELVKESSLMSILRWNFKANMEKMITSDNEHIALANGCELAFISLLYDETGLRIPESFPCLHDDVLAAAADAAISFSSDQKKKQGTKPGILGGIVKGFKSEKIERTLDFTPTAQSNFRHLEDIFLKSPFPGLLPTGTDNQELELNIDDIEIDESPLATGTSSQEVKSRKDKGTEREQLLGKADDMQPRLRTPEEIIAQYRKVGDASSVAAHARNKLVERQEKLERISRRTAELQNGAEDFASLADELVKAMENRKWWQI
ncbi:nucleotide binding protein, putative [Ricinus communis]|uniref:Nucleotide binding protein, putative n=1 Tax=Ricinus communis TaxID=3988 RepID=B9T1J5_RICCO|nr:nucleotide binding protein, putative [Ricinus communis]